MVVVDFEESYAGDGAAGYGYDSIRLLSNSYQINNSNYDWAQVVESTLPLKQSKFAAANQGLFQDSIELRSRQLSRRVIMINLISLLVNLALAVIAFYFSFANNSSATSAFAADCVLDFISSAILLWRYFGDLNCVYAHAREQIACVYLGALFEISGLAIIIKAISDTSSGADPIGEDSETTYELFYLAMAATVACIVLTIFKCSLYKTLRDNSILLDVINTVVSTVFAMSIVMSQALINFNRSFWYLDPVLSMILASFMVVFGLKVIHQNSNVFT